MGGQFNGGPCFVVAPINVYSDFLKFIPRAKIAETDQKEGRGGGRGFKKSSKKHAASVKVTKRPYKEVVSIHARHCKHFFG